VRKGNFLDRLKVKLQLASPKHLSRIILLATSVEISLPIKEKVLQSTQTYLLYRVSRETSISMENVKEGLISDQKSASNKESFL